MASVKRSRMRRLDAKVERVLMATAKAVCDERDQGETSAKLAGLEDLEERYGTGVIVELLRARVVKAARALERKSGLPRHLALTPIPLKLLDPDMGAWLLAVMLEHEVGDAPECESLSAAGALAGVYLMCLMVLADDEDRRPF